MMACAVGVAALGGCDPEDEDEPSVFADTPLAGVINGEPWTFQSGQTDDFLSDDDGFFTSMYQTDEACGGFGDGSPHILTSLPTELGETKMGLSRNLTFSYLDDDDVNQNDVATRGAFRIDAIEDGVISGALQANVDDHEVDGTFTVTICE
jgi:hypothetical protein